VIYEETNRHWFWTSYTLIQDNGDWRIQRMTDEGVSAQSLSMEELQKKTEELNSYLEDFAQKAEGRDLEEIEKEEGVEYLKQLVMHITQAISYNDVLIKKLPLDRSLYAEATALMVATGQYERCLAYLVPLTQRFPVQRALYLRRIADLQLRVSEEYFEEDDKERGELYLDLAEKSLEESLTVENSLEAHVSLAEMFLDDDERWDEAKDHLLAAKELTTDPEDEAHIERHLGEIAMEQEEFQEALSHYQRVVELKPDSANIWLEIGKAHEMLEHFEEAEANYKHVIELEPDDVRAYGRLGKLYSENDRFSQAIEVLEQGLVANPDSAGLHTQMAATYMGHDDYHQAEIFLNKAEQLDPDTEYVKTIREVFEWSKPKPAYATHRVDKTGKQKKRKR
jgi:tetratricopeptide (TPR) repeat protein